ncbi:cupin domain-containing protein [Rhizobium sp. SL86]|uniref:cupin domain-containing protein n=1 Tax=Rhizobium sp. SL86 TaxID=2995148 RepID=UPI00227570E4|nr:cupin domain-containing protein [Rhizobium sp. SL86]MCY1669204.1 cupin domain-containing protein [Rhizobium sp. SL86]
MQQALVTANTHITNAYNKETFVFTHPYDGEDPARFDVILGEGGSGGGNAIAHIHPEADETFHVQEGCLEVMIDGTPHIVEAGHSVTVPKGSAHCFRNAFSGETRATVSFHPPQQQLRFFLNLAMWTAEEPRNFSAKGDAKLLPMALALHAYRDHLYIAGPPIWFQKLLFAVLAPIAGLTGRRLAIKPSVRRQQPAPEASRTLAQVRGN